MDTSANHPQSPEVKRPLGMDLVSKQLPEVGRLRTEITGMDEITAANTVAEERITYHTGLRDKAQLVVQGHTDKIEQHESDIARNDDTHDEHMQTILDLTKLAGDDEHLKNTLSILSFKEGQDYDEPAIDERIRHYMAAKLFERKKLDIAMNILDDTGLPKDKIVAYASRLLKFMFTDTHEHERGLGQTYVYLEPSEQGFIVRAGVIDNFGLIGSVDSTNARLAKEDRQSINQDIPLNSCMVLSRRVPDNDQDYYVLPTSAITFEQEDTASQANELTNGSDTTLRMFVGSQSVQTLIDELHSISVSEGYSQIQQEYALDAIKDIALAIHEATQPEEEIIHSDLLLPQKHINAAILTYASATIDRIATRIVEDVSIDAINYLEQGVQLMSGKRGSGMQFFSSARSFEPINIEDMIRGAVNYAAGEGFAHVYLASHDNEGFRSIVAAIITGVEQQVRVDTKHKTNQDKRLVRICDYLNTYAKQQTAITPPPIPDVEVVPVDEDLENPSGPNGPANHEV